MLNDTSARARRMILIYLSELLKAREAAKRSIFSPGLGALLVLSLFITFSNQPTQVFYTLERLDVSGRIN